MVMAMWSVSVYAAIVEQHQIRRSIDQHSQHARSRSALVLIIEQ